MIGTLLEIIINNMHIMTSVTPLNINFSVDSGGSQKTDSVKNTTTKLREYKNDALLHFLVHYYMNYTRDSAAQIGTLDICFWL
jgi:hypothetical protein